MQNYNLFDQSAEFNHNLYTGIEIHGVRYLNETSVEDRECFVDDENPQFFSIYARHVDGTCLVCADAGMDNIDKIRTLAKDLAARYNWEYQDVTFDKSYEEILKQKRLQYAARPSSEKTKLHHVYIYAIVRVKVSNVEAENHAEAIKKAEDRVDLNGLFNCGSNQEFADDVDCFLVDEVGDEEFANSRWYKKDGVTLLNQPSHSLNLVNLTSGDVGLILDDKFVLTADPNFEPTEQVTQAAINLAAILGVELKIIEMDPPAKDDWSWNDVLLSFSNNVFIPFEKEIPAIDKLQEDYVSGNGNFCPNCRSIDIEANIALEADGLTAWGRVGCSNCKSTWNDQYRLAGFSDLDAMPLSKMPVMK